MLNDKMTMLREQNTPTEEKYVTCMHIKRSLDLQKLQCLGETQSGKTDESRAHRFQVEVQDVVHVGGQGCEQGVVGPVDTHLGDNDGPHTDGQHHRYHGN